MMDPDTAIDVSVDLQKWFLPAVGELAGLAGEEGDSVLQSSIAGAVRAFVAGADKTTIKRTIKTMMRFTTCEGVGKLSNGDAWKTHFHGRYWAMMRVVAFAVEVNFTDFFGGLAGIRTWVIGQLAEQEKADSQSPPAYAGTSSDS
jgi:hypothetical protein